MNGDHPMGGRSDSGIYEAVGSLNKEAETLRDLIERLNSAVVGLSNQMEHMASVIARLEKKIGGQND